MEPELDEALVVGGDGGLDGQHVRLDSTCTPWYYLRPKGDLMKRLVMLALVVIAFASAATSVQAANDGTTVTPAPGAFTLTSAQCHHLPSNTTITATGSGTSVTTTRTDRTGITTISNSTQINGSAKDQAGNSYRFSYSNSFRASNSRAHLDTFTGLMTDLFTLLGRGPARLVNGFIAEIETNATLTSFAFPRVLAAFGDPIDFKTGAVHCDPL